MSLDFPKYPGGNDLPASSPHVPSWQLGSNLSFGCLLFGQIVSALACVLIPFATFFAVRLMLRMQPVPWELVVCQVIGGVFGFFWSAAIYFVFAAVRAWLGQSVGGETRRPAQP